MPKSIIQKIIQFVFIFILIPTIPLHANHKKQSNQPSIKTIWGTVDFNDLDPITQRFLTHSSLKRMQKIDQSGPSPYFGVFPHFWRHDHCLGVWHLLRIFNRPLKEQLTGLYHDISHSAFSHLADHFFGKGALYYQGNHSYQDKIHLEFLRKKCYDLLQIPEIRRTQIDYVDLDPEKYIALDCPLPDLCADRIEYIVHTGLITNLITEKDVEKILECLRFQDGRWFLTEAEPARLIGELSLHFTENLWGAPWNFILYHYFSQALKRAIELKILDQTKFLEGNDQIILEEMERSQDPTIRQYLEKCRTPLLFVKFFTTTGSVYNLSFKVKFRGVDPYVCQNNRLIRLTEIDPAYKKNFNRVRDNCQNERRIILPD